MIELTARDTRDRNVRGRRDCLSWRKKRLSVVEEEEVVCGRGRRGRPW